MLFWTVAGFLVLGCLVAVFRPLLGGRGRAARRASYDMQVYRDQLREIDTDRARGILSAEEAEATRTEISRRLLAAADAEAAETAAQTAPRRLSRATALAAIAATGLAAALLYAAMGAPELPDQPLALREQRLAEARATRPDQAAAEAAVAEAVARDPDFRAEFRPDVPPEDAALIERLRAILKERPDDLAGHRLLARSLGAVGRFPEARAAQEAVVAMQGASPEVADEMQLAELMILAAGGYVSPQAERVIAGVLERVPGNPRARYYSGVTLLQSGRPDLAYPLWTRLLQEGPPDAPWIGPIRAQITEVARMAGRPVPPGVAATPTPTTPGPSQADISAAETMSPDERQAMIAGMVDSLGARLAAEGGPPADWARLIRALGVLGRDEEARAIWTEARARFEGDPEALSVIDAGAGAGGLAP